jgi:hypothetical protein
MNNNHAAAAQPGNQLIEWAADVPYGLSDLASDIPEGYSSRTFVREDRIRCCVAHCNNWMARRRRGQVTTDAVYCEEHGISISTAPTYIYRDYQRNFIVGRQAVAASTKVERWRLGNETSEDALSWNAFVGLLKCGGLTQCFEALTGVVPSDEAELYMWGNRIVPGAAPSVFPDLLQVRSQLEKGVGIPTEPDVILRVPGQAIVLIEAKFGSPNGRFAGKEKRFGTVNNYLRRYFPKRDQDDPLNREWIASQPPDRVLEQLCRNAVFAHWLARDGERAFVVNLVDEKSETDVEKEFNYHLRPGPVTFFRRCWSDILELPVLQADEARPLRRYLKNKTLRLRKAF